MLPSVSAILLTYNCERYVSEAIRSIIEQEYDGPLELIVSDDASTDGTVLVVQRELTGYPGPYGVRFRRRTANSGSKSAHLNDVFPIASGDILISFDADDISEKNRVRRIVEQFQSGSNVQAVYSSYSLIDESGRPRGTGTVPHPPSPRNTSEWFARVDAYAAGSTLAVRRQVIQRFGLLDPEVHEDVVLPFRASLLGEVAFIPEPLVRFRLHAGSLTADWQRFLSIENYRSRFLLGIERARRNAKSRLADLRSAESMMPTRIQELEKLQEIVHETLNHAELTGRLLSPSYPRRISTLIRLVRLGAYRPELLQHVWLALMPGTYLRYKRLSLGVKGGHPPSDR